jgi:hypothetical protein
MPQNFPPSYLPPTNPSPPHSIARTLETSSDSELGAGAGAVGARAWSRSLELPELGAVGAVAGARAEPMQDPSKHLYFFSRLFVLFVLFAMFLWSCATA